MKTSRKRFQVQSGGLLVEKQQHRRRMKAAEEAVEVMRLRQVVADLTERADALGLVLVARTEGGITSCCQLTGEPVSLGRGEGRLGRTPRAGGGRSRRMAP